MSFSKKKLKAKALRVTIIKKAKDYPAFFRNSKLVWKEGATINCEITKRRGSMV